MSATDRPGGAILESISYASGLRKSMSVMVCLKNIKLSGLFFGDFFFLK